MSMAFKSTKPEDLLTCVQVRRHLPVLGCKFSGQILRADWEQDSVRSTPS
jgi:hypothetical protein